MEQCQCPCSALMSTHSFLLMHVMLDHWTIWPPTVPLCYCAAFVPLWYCPRKNTTLLSQKISKGFKRLQQGRRSQLTLTDWFAAKLRWCKSNTGHKIDPERMLLHSEWATATQHQQPFDILSQRCRNIWRQRIGCNMDQYGAMHFGMKQSRQSAGQATPSAWWQRATSDTP